MNEEKNSLNTEAQAAPAEGEAASQPENSAVAPRDTPPKTGEGKWDKTNPDPADDLTGHAPAREDASENTREETQADMEEKTPEQEPAKEETGNGIWSALFNGFAKGGPLILLVAMLCLAWHDFYKPDNAVYCPPEFRTITAFLHCVAQNSWLTPIGLDNGAWIAPQWPGFLWFVGLLALIPGLGASSLLLPVAEFSAAAIAVCAIWWLAHTSKFGSRAAFAAGMMALCCPLFAPLPHFMGPGALAAGLMLLALLFFLKGWRKDFSLLSIPLGFIFTACAGLTGGLAHFATPLAASCCFLVWTGKFRRAQRMDALIGFICLLAIIGVWLGIVMLKGENPDYLPGLFGAYSPAWPPVRHWWFAIAAGFLGSLPWLLTIFGVSWVRVLAKSGQAIRDSRASNGSAMIWPALVIAAALSIWTPNFHSAAVAICSLLLIPLGKAFMRMPKAGNRFFFFLAALIATVAGLALCAMHFELSQNWLLETTGLPVPDIARQALLRVPAFLFIGGILAGGGIVGFYFAKRFRHAGGLLYALLIAILLCQPGRLFVVPELAADPALPVRTFDAIQAEVMSRLASAGQRAPVIESVQPAPAPTVMDQETPTSQPPAISPMTPAEPGANQSTAPERTLGEQPGSQPPTRGSTIPPANSPLPEETTQPVAPEAPALREEVPQTAAPDGGEPESAPPPALGEPTLPVPPAPPAETPQPEGAVTISIPPADEAPALDLPERSEVLEADTQQLAKPGPDMPDHPVTGESGN